MRKKRILIPNGNFSEWALINAAHRHGMYVIVSGLNENAPGNQFADEYIKADYSDKEAMLQLAKEKKIDYMMSNAHDAGTLSTAYVCEQLGLPGHDSYETTLTLHTKNRLKPLAKKLGLHTPIAEIFGDKDSALQYVCGQIESGKKIILKPSDNVASVGVVAPKTTGEAEAAVNLAFEKSKSHTIIVEPFLDGFFVTCTSMIINQKVEAFFANAGLFYQEGEVEGPEFPMNHRCNGGMEPAPYMNEWKDYIIEDFNKIAKELKLVDGKFHAEIMVAPDHSAQIFDLHRRFSGFSEPCPEWNHSTGLMWEDWVLRAECGMDLSNFPKGIKQDRYFHHRKVYAPQNGKLKRMVFDEYLTARLVPMCHPGSFDPESYRGFHTFPFFPKKNFVMENVEITDYRHQPLIHVRLRFDTLEEAEFMSDFCEDHFYEHVTFEYED